MTSQTKTFIELVDIIGLQIECKNCGVSLLINQKNLASLTDQHNSSLRACPTCASSWTQLDTYTPPGTRAGFDSEIKAMVRAINQVKELQDKLGCSLTLEINATKCLSESETTNA
jgi:hypothetical protein